MKRSVLAPLCLAGLIATGTASASSLDTLSKFSVDDICYPTSHDTASIVAGEAMCRVDDSGLFTEAGGIDDLISSLDLSVPVWDEEFAGLDLMTGEVAAGSIPDDPSWAPSDDADSLEIVDDVAPSIIDDASVVDPGAPSWG